MDTITQVLIAMLTFAAPGFWIFWQSVKREKAERLSSAQSRQDRLENERDLFSSLVGKALVLGYKLLVFCSGPDEYKTELELLDRQYRLLLENRTGEKIK